MSNGENFDDQQQESAFEQAKAKYRQEFAGMALQGLVEAMQGAGVKKSQIEDDLRDCNAKYDVLRFEAVPERMELDGVETVRYAGIGRVSLTSDIRVSVKPGAKDHLFSWLRKRKLSDLIQDAVNASTLKAFIKGRMKTGKDFPSEFVNVTPITRASITKG